MKAFTEWWNWFRGLDGHIQWGVRWLLSATFVALFIILIGGGGLLRGLGFFLLGIGVAPLGLYLANIRTESLQHQTNTEKEKAVTESFAKSVELLGINRETARQGGIYALGRLARDNSELHSMIMDIVASYIRQESKTYFDDNKTIETDTEAAVIEKLSSKPMPMDIEAAIAVIRDRVKSYDRKPRMNRYILDLSNTYIFNADFTDTSLKRVNFSDSVLVRCAFDGTDITDSNFQSSNMKGTDFSQDQYDSAYIQEAAIPPNII